MDIECRFCGTSFDEDEIAEMTDMGDGCWRTESEFVCQDCCSEFRRKPLEDQLKAALSKSLPE